MSARALEAQHQPAPAAAARLERSPHAGAPGVGSPFALGQVALGQVALGQVALGQVALGQVARGQVAPVRVRFGPVWRWQVWGQPNSEGRTR